MKRALVFGLLLSAFGLVQAQMVTGKVKNPLLLQKDYTMANPAVAPPVALTSTTGTQCVSTKTYRWYTVCLNEGGYTNLSPASADIVVSNAACTGSGTPYVCCTGPGAGTCTLKKVSVTLASSCPSNSKGWAALFSCSGSGCDAHATKYFSNPASGNNPATSLEQAFIANGTTTGTMACNQTSAITHNGTNQTGVKSHATINSLANETIGLTSFAGGNINLLAENIHRIQMLNGALQGSFDGGITTVTWGADIPTAVHICKSGCPFSTVTSALASISDASSSKRYVVVIHPGDYIEGTGGTFAGGIPLSSSYVSLMGLDRNTTRIDRLRLSTADINEVSVSNLTFVSMIPANAVNTVPLNFYVVDCNIGIVDGSFASAGIGDARGLWADTKQTVYSIGNLIRGNVWGLANYSDGTIISSGDTIDITQDSANSPAAGITAIDRDEGGGDVRINGANITVRTNQTSNPVSGIGCIFSPGNGPGSRPTIFKITNSLINIISTNASRNAALSCITVPNGGCAETGALAADFDLSGTRCTITAADSSSTLRGVDFPSDADAVNWTVNWSRGLISLTGGATREAVNNANTASGSSVTLTDVERTNSVTGAGKIYTPGVASPTTACSAKCVTGTMCANTSPALCQCTAADTWTKVSGGGACP